MEDKLLKIIKFKSYKDVIGYDLLFIFGFVFMTNIRYLMIVLLTLFNVLYFKIKNYELIEVYENKLILSENKIVILRDDIKKITKGVGKSGISSVIIEYIDDCKNNKIYEVESPDSASICRYLKKYSEKIDREGGTYAGN